MDLQDNTGNVSGDLGNVGTEPGQSQTSDGDNTAQFNKEQQEVINKIVSQRVNETKTNLSPELEKAKILDNMFRDPEFVTWLEGKGNGNNTPNQQAPSNPLEGIDSFEGLAKALPDLIKSVVSPMIKPFEQTANNLQAVTRQTALQTELQRMATTIDDRGNNKFAYLSDPGFRNDVEQIINSGRAYKLDDAYALVTADRNSNGIGLPNSNYLLQSRGNGSRDNHRSSNTPDFSNAPKFAKPEDALRYAFEKYSK
jgi:hypothetical protein